EPRLNAFVSIEDHLPGVDGKLGGLPYAAKDIFRTASHRPTGGLATPTDVAVDGETDLLARLDGASARRVGFTALPELAYEPSGYNHARGRVRNPWNPDFVAGGSSSGSAGSRCERQRRRRARLRHGRLAAHSRPLLRRHRLEADPWP